MYFNFVKDKGVNNIKYKIMMKSIFFCFCDCVVVLIDFFYCIVV